MGIRLDGKRKSHTVGALVLTAFVGPRPTKCEVSHLDGDPTHNNLANLRWETKRDNEARKYLQRAPTSCRTSAEILDLIRRMKLTGKTYDQIAPVFGYESTRGLAKMRKVLAQRVRDRLPW